MMRGRPMVTLALDCSCVRGSVAVLADGEMLFAEEFLAEILSSSYPSLSIWNYLMRLQWKFLSDSAS